MGLLKHGSLDLVNGSANGGFLEGTERGLVNEGFYFFEGGASFGRSGLNFTEDGGELLLNISG